MASAQAQLAAGVLALREPGGPASASTGIGPADGLPRTFTAGRALASPGGYAPGIAREVTDEELPDAAEQEARTSGAWAKVIGDSLVSGRANFSAQALAEATRRVHAVGARMAVHVVGLRAVAEAAIEAGVDSIEHGMPLGSDHLAAMAASLPGRVRRRPDGVRTGAMSSTIAWGQGDIGTLAAVTAAVSGSPCPSQTRCSFTPGLPRSTGFAPTWSPAFGAHASRVHTGARPVQATLLAELVEDVNVQCLEYASLGPLVQASPRGRWRATAKLARWQQPPRGGGAGHIDDRGEAAAITDSPVPAAVGRSG